MVDGVQFQMGDTSETVRKAGGGQGCVPCSKPARCDCCGWRDLLYGPDAASGAEAPAECSSAENFCTCGPHFSTSRWWSMHALKGRWSGTNCGFVTTYRGTSQQNLRCTAYTGTAGAGSPRLAHSRPRGTEHCAQLTARADGSDLTQHRVTTYQANSVIDQC